MPIKYKELNDNLVECELIGNNIEYNSNDDSELIYIIDNYGQIREVSKKYIEKYSENVFIIVNKYLYDNLDITSLKYSDYNNDLLYGNNNVTDIYLYKDNVYYADVDKDDSVVLKCVGCCCIFLFVFIGIWLLNFVSKYIMQEF